MSDSDAYPAVMEAARETARAFGPDVVIVALGLDAASSDPFTGMNVDEDGCKRIGERFGRLCRKTLLV
jgi:acetoin utilization deacetylase AcuC-like enzyme